MSKQDKTTHENGEHEDSTPKKLTLKVRARVPAQTSKGTYYLRHFRVGDAAIIERILKWDMQEPHQAHMEIGDLVLQTLTCEQAEGEASAISQDTFANLTTLDKEGLAQAAAKASDLSLKADMEPVEALGLASHAYSQECMKAFERTQKRVADAFKGVGTGILSSLQNNLAGMRSVREQLGLSSTVGQLLESENARIRKLNETATGQRVVSAASDALKSLTPIDRIGSIVQRELFDVGAAMRDSQLGSIAAAAKIGEVLPKQPELSTLPTFTPPKFENTPGGRAAIRATAAMEASAKELQEVTGLVGVMSTRLSELHELVLTEVMPTWVENLKEGAESAQESFKVSLFGVKVALWTAAASAVIACALTGWQLWIARDYKQENDNQQDRIELLLQQQLKSSQELNRVLGSELTRTREELAKLNRTAAVRAAPSREVRRISKTPVRKERFSD
jgi:hypothetical protein